jgi:transcriptional regulator with XRE-family HTH domain
MCAMGSAAARFGANLREARTEAGLTQEALAYAAGLHRTEISLLELGGREPRLGTIVRLARGLGIDAAQLVRGIA